MAHSRPSLPSADETPLPSVLRRHAGFRPVIGVGSQAVGVIGASHPFQVVCRPWGSRPFQSVDGHAELGGFVRWWVLQLSREHWGARSRAADKTAVTAPRERVIDWRHTFVPKRPHSNDCRGGCVVQQWHPASVCKHRHADVSRFEAGSAVMMCKVAAKRKNS